jgi:hypothetical protein
MSLSFYLVACAIQVVSRGGAEKSQSSQNYHRDVALRSASVRKETSKKRRQPEDNETFAISL